MIYLIDGKKENIPVEEKPFGQGSEGKIYKKGKYTYKIYFKNMLNEGHGQKENFHKYLLTIPTKQIILPDKMIYSEDGAYQGYRTPLIPGSKRKKTGITLFDSKILIKNLQTLEKDFQTLSSNFVLVSDITPINYILNKKNNTMNIIDPGKYRHHCLDHSNTYISQNDSQLENLIELLLYLDFIEYKPINSKRKIQELKEYLKAIKRKEGGRYSEFFEEKLQNFENINEYAKSLIKYIK